MTDKKAKSDVGYTDWGTEAEHCGNCVNYIFGGQLYDPSCKKVEGKIDFKGWCQLWQKETSS